MDASLGLKDMDVVDPSLQPAIKDAIARGVDGLVLTQVKVNGKGTGWGAQHDQRTLKPTNARKFEPASLSGMETVGLVQVLMRVEQPSEKVKQAINDAVNWLTSVQIKGYTYLDIEDASQPKGKDRIIKPDANSTIWARFYDLETNQPIFSGRDGEKKKNLNEIEVERRVGYAWYGVWPKKLIEKDYATWLKKNEGIANKN
jgi:PelA/Pel-15E family pectate lyase